MNEKRYTIEKIEKLNDDIKVEKYTTVVHAISSALIASQAFWLSFQAAPLTFSTSGVARVTVSGLLAAVSVAELVNGNTTRKNTMELLKIKEELLNNNTAEVLDENANEYENSNGRGM